MLMYFIRQQTPVRSQEYQAFKIKYSVLNVTKFKGIHKKFIQNIVEEIPEDIIEVPLPEIKVKDLNLKGMYCAKEEIKKNLNLDVLQ